MKRIFCLTLFLGFGILTASAQTTPKNIVLTWQQPANMNQWAICSSTVTVVCADHMTLVDTTVPSVPVTLTSTMAPTATTYTTPIPAGNAYATRLYVLTLVYKDAAGANQFTSGATCGSANTAPPCAVAGIPVVPPPNPTNFSGTVQ